MPLEPIASHRPPSTDARAARRVLALAFVGVACAVLVSCSQGTSRDAERGREVDAERTSVVDLLQATETSRLISGTPAASPPADDDD